MKPSHHFVVLVLTIAMLALAISLPASDPQTGAEATMRKQRGRDI